MYLQLQGQRWRAGMSHLGPTITKSLVTSLMLNHTSTTLAMYGQTTYFLSFWDREKRRKSGLDQHTVASMHASQIKHTHTHNTHTLQYQ